MNTASEELQAGSYEEEACIARAKEILASRVRNTDCFTTPQVVKDFLILNSAGLEYEVFSVLYLDSQNRLIKFVELFRGTLTQTSVYPREIAVQALQLHAASVILSHNHPSGACRASKADETLTQTIKSALDVLSVRVLDHIIVAGGSSFSMAEKGLV